MPDGTQLDFAEGGDYRGTDHRAIGAAYKGVAEHQWQYLQDFENRGGIRIHMNRDGKYGTIEMAIKPTAEQKKKLRSFINAVGGNVDIDFMDENYNTTHAVSYEGVSPTRALSGITNFYDKGIKPKGNESYSISRDEIVSIVESEGTVSYSLVKDEAKIAELEASPKRIGYRNMVLNEDGTLSAPMASSLSYPSRKKDTEIKMAVSELGKWEQADEHPELVNEKGKVTIYQPENGAGTTVNYDPYIHSRQDRVNTQLKGAWRRPNLVYVEVEIPTTDLESGYQADKAALPVGAHEWAGGSGIVMLSMYDKPVRIADWNDVADDWMKRFGNEPIHFDIIPPQLLPILAERGANITSPHPGLGVDVYKAYDKFKAEQGVSYSVNREDSSKKNSNFEQKKHNNEKGFEQNNDGWQPSDRNRVVANGVSRISQFSGRGDIRVFEEGVETPSSVYSVYSERDRRRKESERLVDIAKQHNLFVPQNAINFGEKHPKRTSESVVYVDKNTGRVFKVKNPYANAPMKQGVRPEDAIYEHIVHNLLFPETAYRFEGISENLGDVRIILSQEFIPSYSLPTKSQIVDALTSKGLVAEDNYHFGNDLVSVTDVEGDNVLLGEDGKIYFIDPIIDFKKPVKEVISELEKRMSESYSLNRDTTVATPEMVAEANEKLTESEKAAKAIADEIEERIKKIAQSKELTFEQIEQLMLDENDNTAGIRRLVYIYNQAQGAKPKKTQAEADAAVEELKTKYKLTIDEAKAMLKERGTAYTAMREGAVKKKCRAESSALSLVGEAIYFSGRITMYAILLSAKTLAARALISS